MGIIGLVVWFFWVLVIVGVGGKALPTTFYRRHDFLCPLSAGILALFLTWGTIFGGAALFGFNIRPSSHDDCPAVFYRGEDLC